MPTYIIVDKDKDPVGPNELNASEAISVSDGDVFIIDPSADGDITFQASGGVPADFEIQIATSNTNGFSIKVEDDLTPSFTIDNNVDLTDIDIDTQAADAVNLDIGDNVTLDKFEGATDGPNTVVIGDDFTTDSDWKFGDADDSLTVGNDATFKNLDAGDGNDTITFGDGATVQDFDTKNGDDSVTFGDDLDASDVKTGEGDDTIRIGKNAQASTVDGGNDNDEFYTETTGLDEKNIESSQVVCYGLGTLIDTPFGERKVETLRAGDMVETLDAGPCPVRWVRSDHRPLDGVPDDERPVLIQANALGDCLPFENLIVSPQHRILVGGGGQFECAFDSEFFVPAKALTDQPGIRHMRGKSKITWVHFALDRHHVVRANGCQSESLYLGPMVIKALTQSEHRHLQEVFRAMPSQGPAMNGPPARPFLTIRATRRHFANHLAKTRRCVAGEVRQWERDLSMEKHDAKLMREADRLTHSAQSDHRIA